MSETTVSKRGVRSWMLFDWANQPFYTLIITFIFAPYFAAEVTGDAVQGQALWARITAIGGLTVAILAPILGAVADQSGPRKPWIAVFSVLFVFGCCGLWLAAPGTENLWLVLALFLIAFIGSEFMLIFTNAMLPDLGPREEIGRISGSGWALGYVGGVLVLILVLLLLSPSPGKETTLLGINPILGLDPQAGEPARATGPLTALWFAVFAVPLFLYTPDAPRRAQVSGAVTKGLRQLGRTLVALPAKGTLLIYLLASMIYRDALAALYIFGGIFAKGILGWGLFELGVFGIIAAATGAVGAWIGGRADRSFGPKPVIFVSIIILMAVAATTLLTTRSHIFGLPVTEGSGLPDTIFFFCGAMIGAAGGALQASSRTMLVHQAEAHVPMTEAFGLYALSGKATAFIGPAAIGIATTLSGSQRLGITPVIGLFALGLFLLLWVKTRAEVTA
ncbi:MFS transporter [Algicella marina]|uniref:MFS transporter n=1 Tax=Algicella marina TaxID=2683284 RepID=A0A6P1T614_9RHOB|nr:MFS transporter [Algicella marina]QHQ36002.1 MFS transporter [Algicella marina]